MRVLTAAQIRAVEERAVDTGLDYLRLMENAGSACARFVAEKAQITLESNTAATVVCGKGKNGGDGFVIARKLYDKGAQVCVVLAAGEPTAADALEMYTRMTALPIEVVHYDTQHDLALEKIRTAQVLVDAMFGIGFYGDPNEQTARLFEAMSASPALKIAVDLPSGVNCDVSLAPKHAFHADCTAAISTLKPAHVLFPAASLCGEVSVVRIGIPDSCYEEEDGMLFSIEEEAVRGWFAPRDPVSNKGDYGHLLSICGSRRMPGAAVLAAKGAVAMGAGLVTAAFPEGAYAAIASKLTEPLLLPLYANREGTFAQAALPELRAAMEKASAILIGCGLGMNDDTAYLVSELLSSASCPVVLDADGINIAAAHIDMLKNRIAPLILTPHPGEMARLCGCTAAEIQADRTGAARRFAQEYGVTLVLKGANTVIADGRSASLFVNRTGNPGMAKGGSGDLLAGMLASLAAQGMEPLKAAAAAVYLHGLAGDEVAKRCSMCGMTPTLIAEELAVLLKRFGG